MEGQLENSDQLRNSDSDQTGQLPVQATVQTAFTVFSTFNQSNVQFCPFNIDYEVGGQPTIPAEPQSPQCMYGCDILYGDGK